MSELVFGYGSLAAGGEPATLPGHRRAWRVAMDNSRDLPGYKYYVDADTGERPPVFVAFLDLVPDRASAVNGVVFPVGEETLAALDARERNYERREVAIGDATAWAYFGTAAAHHRYRRGRASGAAVISQEYRDAVRAGFDRLGPGELERFDASTSPPDVPTRRLRRVELPQTDG